MLAPAWAAIAIWAVGVPLLYVALLAKEGACGVAHLPRSLVYSVRSLVKKFQIKAVSYTLYALKIALERDVSSRVNNRDDSELDLEALLRCLLG